MRIPRQTANSTNKEKAWPDTTTSKAGARRAPTPPTKSEPPQEAADISPNPAAAPEEVTP
jgi:hypothetical protein